MSESRGSQDRPRNRGVRLSMNLSERTHQALKQEALDRRISITELVTRLIEEELFGKKSSENGT